MNSARKPKIEDAGASLSLLHDMLRTPKGRWVIGAVIAGLALTGKPVAEGGGSVISSVVTRSHENNMYDTIQRDKEGALAAFDHGEYRGLDVVKVTPKPGQTLMSFAATIAERGDVENIRNLGEGELGGSSLQGQPLIFPEGMVQDKFEDPDQRPAIDKPQP
jgi:hypothetical protein